MAYVGNTARLCQAIVDGDIEHIEGWLSQDGADPNRRDYTGRTPLHLAVISSTSEVVKCLVDHGARITPRLVDGQTALHLASAKGDCQMVKILLERSNANEEEEGEKQDQRRKARSATLKDGEDIPERETTVLDAEGEDTVSDGELIDDDTSDQCLESMATGSFVKVGENSSKKTDEETVQLEDDLASPDFYKIDAVAWDSNFSPLHLAIFNGHCDVVRMLCQEFGADVLLPVKIWDGGSEPLKVILTLVLTLALPVEKAVEMTETLLSLGATSSQADTNGITAFHRYIRSGGSQLIESLWANDKIGLKTALNHVAVSGSFYDCETLAPLITAVDRGDPTVILKLLEAGANPEIDFETWLRGAKFSFENNLRDYESNKTVFNQGVSQPLIIAIQSSNPSNAIRLLERGADPNVITKASSRIITDTWRRRDKKGQSALDVVQDALMKLREYRGEKVVFHLPWRTRWDKTETNDVKAPKGPFGTSEFLKKFQRGTYQHWIVSMDIEDGVKAYKKELDRFKKEKDRKDQHGSLSKKKEAIHDAISQLEEVEKALKARGAKHFKELYPDADWSIESSDEKDKPTSPYGFDFNFIRIKDLTDKRKATYIEL